MTYLVLNEEHDIIDSHSSDEEYGSWYEHYSFSSPTEAYSTQDQTYGSVPYIGPELEEATVLYVIYVVWSSGDSFGSSDRGCYDFLVVNTDKDRAYRNLKLIQEAKSLAILELDDGSTMKQYCGAWEGHFESLDELAVAEVLYMGENSEAFL